MKRRPSSVALLALCVAMLIALSACVRARDDVVGGAVADVEPEIIVEDTEGEAGDEGAVTVTVDTPEAAEEVIIGPAEEEPAGPADEAGEAAPTEGEAEGAAEGETLFLPTQTPEQAEAQLEPTPATVEIDVAAEGEAEAVEAAPTLVAVEPTPVIEGAAGAEVEAAAAAQAVTLYTVQRGDTLFSIARRYNTTVEAIQQANNLPNSFIYVGQQLRIPTAAVPAAPTAAPAAAYIVQRGDTLTGIASRFNTTVAAIAAANNLATPYVIYVGQQLVIPGATAAPAPPPAAPVGGTGQVYIVQRGDTLYSIARRYNTTVEAIQRANNLAGSRIYAGQSLVIP